MSLELVSSPQPHYIPGYTGFCPQYKYREGNTYGSTTHKLLLDATVNHSENLVLSDRTVDDYQVVRPPQTDIDIVQARFQHTEPIYDHPIIPGYEGFVPRANGLLGQRMTVCATEGLSSFEQQQLNNKAALNKLEKQTKLQNEEWQPRSTDDRLLTESEFKLPLLEVRPECAGVLRSIVVDEGAVTPPRQSISPYFQDNSDPDKHFKTGFSGHIPFGYAEMGKGYEAFTNSALYDFTSNYRHRMGTEWAPVNVSQPDPPLVIQPSEIYHKNVGLIPSYKGHIPGAIFRFGKTYGNDSIDAKRWLRGDFSI